jgi:hypothetical protein
MATTAAATTAGRPRALHEVNTRFALGMAAAMFVVNFVGFGPTFFLRPFFDVPQMPFYLYLHGVLGTAWFALVIAQAGLIANRNFTRHRQLGWCGVGLVAAMIGLGVYTSTHMVPRNAAAHPPLTDADIQLYSGVTAADLAGFILIPTLIALAVWFRRRPDIHMRLLLIATIEVTGPAVARIASWGSGFIAIIPIIVLSLMATLVVHDLWTLRRVHRATIFGVVFFYAVNITMQLSGVGPAIVAYRLAHL